MVQLLVLLVPTHLALVCHFFFFFSSRRRHTRSDRDWSSDVCSSDLLDTNFERVLSTPGDMEAQGHMQIGAFLAGLAIEHSMLGATHACANPLSANYDKIGRASCRERV